MMMMVKMMIIFINCIRIGFIGIRGYGRVGFRDCALRPPPPPSMGRPIVPFEDFCRDAVNKRKCLVPRLGFFEKKMPRSPAFNCLPPGGEEPAEYCPVPLWGTGFVLSPVIPEASLVDFSALPCPTNSSSIIFSWHLVASTLIFWPLARSTWHSGLTPPSSSGHGLRLSGSARPESSPHRLVHLFFGLRPFGPWVREGP
jgi:hypothetical protein